MAESRRRKRGSGGPGTCCNCSCCLALSALALLLLSFLLNYYLCYAGLLDDCDHKKFGFLGKFFKDNGLKLLPAATA